MCFARDRLYLYYIEVDQQFFLSATSFHSITDFYRSQLLRYTIAFTQVLSQFIWMCSNVVALKNAFNGAFGLDPDYPWITVAIVGE